MRLHLPKTLLAAVLAACAALPTWGEDSGVSTGTTTYTVTVGGTKKTFSSLNVGLTLPTTTTDAFWLSSNTSGSKVEVNNTAQTSLNLAGTIILGSGSYTTTSTSEEGTTTTTASTQVPATQLFLQGWQATGAIKVTSALIVGANSGEYGAALRFGADGNHAVEVSGDITVAEDAKFIAGGTRAVISGGITGAGKTLTLSNSNSAGTYTMRGADGKSIELGGLTISGNTSVILNYASATIGTLTLNSSSTSAALTLTGSGTTTITSLVTSGSVLDASEMTGTLTIEGAKWTGNLTVASVEVLKAKDAGTATILANSMNTTRGISYSFSATDTSVYRVLRTDSLTDLTAVLQGNPGSRIVVNATYDGTTFTNVGLNELLAGDKVTINGLTGWIGDNSSNSISANLVFEGVNSINNGSSNGTINYSGAISGSGTLSFDWIATESDGSTTIKTNTYVFTGDLSGFAGTIKDDATLNVTIGGTLAEGVSNAVKATIDIAGVLTVNRDATFTNTVQAGDNIKVTSGVFRVEKSASTNKELDLSAGDSSTGCVEIASGASLTVGTNIWGRSNGTFASKILLEKDANLVWDGFTITGKTAKDGVETGLRFGANDTTLASDNSAHSVTNSVITSTGTKTLGWTLTDTDLVVQSGTLRLGANVNASNVTVSAGSTLELVSGWKQELSSSNTTWESGAKLRYVSTNAVNLDVGTVSGSTIELYGVTGTLNAASSAIKGDIVLTNNGQDAAAKFETISGTSYTFDGKVKGGGNLLLNEANKTTNLNFNGNLSEWVSGSEVYSGLYVMAGTVNATIGVTEGNTISDNSVANAFNAASGAQLNLTIARDAVLTNKMNITSLAVNDGKTLELRNDTNAVAVGNTTVGAGSKLILDNKRTAEDGTTTYGSINLGTVSGSGTISSSMESQSISLSTDKAKTFSGTLEATSGKLTVTGMSIADGYHLMTALKAAGGNLDLMNTTLVSITEMVIGENATVGVYGGTTASEENEGGVYVHGVGASTKGALTVESGATLKSDLQLVNTVLTFNGSLTMGSDLTLYSGNELAGSLYTSWDKKSALTLFTGVDNLTIGTEVAVADKEYKASEVFSNIGNDYSLKMTGSTGDYIVQLVQSTPAPEPTTATLSLLALMGLAARRRRRKA